MTISMATESRYIVLLSFDNADLRVRVGPCAQNLTMNVGDSASKVTRTIEVPSPGKQIGIPNGLAYCTSSVPGIETLGTECMYPD